MCERPYFFHRQTVQLLAADESVAKDPRLMAALADVTRTSGVQLTSREEAIVFGECNTLYRVNVHKVMCLGLHQLHHLHGWILADERTRRELWPQEIVQSWGEAAAKSCLMALLPLCTEVTCSSAGFKEVVVADPDVPDRHVMYVLYNASVLKALVGLTPFSLA